MDSLIFTPADIDKILDSLEEHINKIDKFNNDYDFRIYNEFLSYFSTLDEIDFHKLAISSTYIFGTMPTTSAITVNISILLKGFLIIIDEILKNWKIMNI